MKPKEIIESDYSKKLCHHHTGGLTEAGFTDDEKYLLLVSHSGRGLIALSSGELVDRNNEEPLMESAWINDNNKKVQALNPIKNEWVKVFGLWGGQLKNKHQQWSIFYETPSTDTDALLVNDKTAEKYKIDTMATEVYTFGFSESGKYLVLATSSDVLVYEKNA